MVVQMNLLGWPVPDVIVPLPREPFNFLLAKYLSLFLSVPAIKALKRKGFFRPEEFAWNGFVSLSDKKVLSVDLFFSDAFRILEESAAEEIYFISLLRRFDSL